MKKMDCLVYLALKLISFIAISGALNFENLI